MKCAYLNNILTTCVFQFPALHLDFNAMTTNVTFEVSDTEKCVEIHIVNTFLVEMTESFFVTLERTEGLDELIQIDPAAVEGEIEIWDDDSTCNIISEASLALTCI